MFVIKKKRGETDDKLIARFRKKTIMEGVLQEFRDRERYKKPSEKRKEQNIELPILLNWRKSEIIKSKLRAKFRTFSFALYF